MKNSAAPKIGIVIAITFLLLLSSIGTESSQPINSVSYEEFAIQQPSSPEIGKFIDPVVRTHLAESGATQSVSIKMTHELSLEEITEIESQGVTFRRRGGTIVHAGQIYLAEIESTKAFDAVSVMEYVEQLQADYTTNELTLDTSINEIGAVDVYNLTDPVNDAYNITGKGITVAVIDSGIDWQHPDFYFADGGAFVYRNDGVEGAYIDLDDDSTYDVGEKAYYYDLTGDGGSVSVIDSQFDWLISDTNDNTIYDYGIDFMFLVNDTSLNGVLDFGEYCIRLGTSKIQQIWDQTTGDFFVRGVNLTNTVLNTHLDTNGHGTHVAGTVAGGQVGLRAFNGVAPDAELLIVKTTFATLDIMDSVIWAVNEGADVITMSIGGYIYTPLDGSTNFEQTFDWAVDQGVPCTISAGNAANDYAHSLFTIPATTEASDGFSVFSTGQEEVLVTALWMNSTNDITLRIQSPSSTIYSIPLDGTVINVNNNEVSATRYTSPRGTAYINIYITFTAPRSDVENGPWELYYDNSDASGQEIHTYIYPSGDNEMTYYPNITYTVGSPSTADKVISVASYVTKLGYASPTLDDISVFSSIGPRVDGVQKPDIAAPGEQIKAAHSQDAGGSPGAHVLMSGTSMSCPHVAGVLALMIQSHPSGMVSSPATLYNQMSTGATTDGFTGLVPNSVWGYGKVNAFEAVVRDEPSILGISIDDVSKSNLEHTDAFSGVSFNVSVQVSDDQSHDDLTVDVEYGEVGVDGSYPLVYDSISDRWNVTMQFVVPVLTSFNCTVIVWDPLFMATIHTFYMDVQSLEGPPYITPHVDIEYAEFDIGNSISWVPLDDNPENYTIFQDSIILRTGLWNTTFEIIIISVDGLPLGEYNYTLLVFDEDGNSTSDVVIVTVFDGTLPTISHPDDIAYTLGEIGNNITWIPEDYHPVSYEILRDGVSQRVGNWNASAEVITWSVDNLTLGEYEFTLVVTDIGNNSQSDDVIVTVQAETVDTSTTTTDTSSTTTTTESPEEDEIRRFVVVGSGLGIIIVLIIISRKIQN